MAQADKHLAEDDLDGAEKEFCKALLLDEKHPKANIELGKIPVGDMTERTVSALGEADVVCAEDTRVTGKLLAAFGIEKRLERLDEALIGDRAAPIVERVLAGEVIAYCSDAGMPGVSDPGLRLVRGPA